MMLRTSCAITHNFDVSRMQCNYNVILFVCMGLAIGYVECVFTLVTNEDVWIDSVCLVFQDTHIITYSEYYFV